MKKIAILILLIVLWGTGICQYQKEIDSLRQVIKTTTVDSAKALALCRLSYYELQPALRLELAYKGLALSKQIKWPYGEARCYIQLSNCFRNISDLANAMDNALKALKKYEEVGAPEGIGNALGNVGSNFQEQGRYQEALTYHLKANEVYRNAPNLSAVYQGIHYMFFGQAYLELGINDSTLIYFNRAFETLPKTNGNLAGIYIGLANVYAANKDFDLAQSYHKKAIAAIINSPGSLSDAHLEYALFFDKINKRDSAIYYARLSMEGAMQVNYKITLVKAAKLLSTLYEKTNDKEALMYYKIASQTRDSVFNQVTAAKLQSMEYAEGERQRELNEIKRMQQEERQNNLQYAAIAFALFTIMILFLVLSHSILANQKLIRFFGVISLLIVFEFLNLLLHPWLGAVTHHSPILMLLAMVGVAALLVPLHHRLEHWITHKMIEKNNTIRLAAAKRTIQQMEALDLEKKALTDSAPNYVSDVSP